MNESSPPAAADLVFRVHPAVGVARVGNSEEQIIAPETMAGASTNDGSLTGGLPIRAGTEVEPVRSSDLRDEDGALKRHAARFRVFAYQASAEEQWPRGDAATVTEVTIGSTLAGRVVEDIVWTVHVANKKANTFVLMEEGPYQGIAGFEEDRLPPIRNTNVEDPQAPQPTDELATLNDPARVAQLTIDPGPRTISGQSAAAVRFDRATPASYYDAAQRAVVTLDSYPKSFPTDAFKEMDAPSGPIETLGELTTDANGRLLVAGGYGRAAGWRIDGKPAPLGDDVNNDQWFDDTSDGPVSATIVFADGGGVEAHGAWVTTTDPSYAPQIRNVVSLWDDIYDVWVRELGLAPDVYNPEQGGYQDAYQPTFDDQLAPIFKSAALQRWVANIGPTGEGAHEQVGTIDAIDDPATTPLAGIKSIFRNPFAPDDGVAKMPLHLGDANEAFLSLRKTQYFFLERWNEGRDGFRAGSGPELGPGELLDKATFVNCIGGRFSPGIDLTFVMREPALYVQPWQTSGAGPFRVKRKPLAYGALPVAGAPLLTAGYVPRHVEDGLEPGDLSKWMALPWHTDYNSCATHPPSPNPKGNRTVFWSWPAQRPVAVYSATDVTWSEQREEFGEHSTELQPVLPKQLWSVRGPGTDSPDAENWGRFQNRMDMLRNWQRIGVVVQAPAIDASLPGALPDDWYLEADGQLVDTGKTPVEPFPNIASEIDPGNALELDPRELFFKLLNLNDYPDVLPAARAYVKAWLTWSEDFSNDAQQATWDQLFFPYTEDAFQERLDAIYQDFVDQAETSDPTQNLVKTYADAVTRIIQLAPFNLVDGAWLRNIGMPGPIDDARSLLYSVSMDELGDGDVSMNHCNIYRDLCHSVGYYPSDIYSSDFAYDPRFLDSAFTVPAFELAISQFTGDYYPELLGMTLQLEWSVIDLKPTRDLMEYFGINPHFYVMHIGIDNAVDGHGARAAEAIRLYLRVQHGEGGEAAVAAAWRRIWNGFVAFGSIGTFGADFEELLTTPPSYHQQMLAMIGRKADFGSRNHQDLMIGPTRINEWFSDPEGFLEALRVHAYITPGDWANSRMNELLNFETGPMYRVFTPAEIALWASYVAELSQPQPQPPPPTPDLPPARAMAAVIDQLRPVQRGIAGHATNTLADERGLVHPLAWWFERPTRELMRALASPLNDVISLGAPDRSRFLMELIAPTGPMGPVFDLPAEPPGSGSCRDVVRAWIEASCPVPYAHGTTLRLNSLQHVRNAHPTGKIVGMGTIH
jgi:L-Lysine epsilon oxidase N-terminal/L-lysine epsilon oxidase C-terminal domain/Iron-containing redox enzyme